MLDGFEEVQVDKEHSEITIPLRNIELSLSIRYSIKGGEMGCCGLLINGIRGSGIKGKLAAAAAKAYIGRTIFIFLSKIENGKELITVPALFEKEPTFDGKLNLSGLIIKTYYHNNFNRSVQEVYIEHLKAIEGIKLNTDIHHLRIGLLDLPRKGVEILKSYR